MEEPKQLTGAVEIRVHGVAGTPPDAMLADLELAGGEKDDCGRPGADISVWRRKKPRPHAVHAYSWGSVTSGKARTALYLLLVPFVFVNMAAWALLPARGEQDAALSLDGPARPWSVRAGTLLVRLAGLSLTLIYAHWSLLVTLDIGAYQSMIRSFGRGAGWLSLAVGLTWMSLELVRWVTRVRIRAGYEGPAVDRQLTDPVGYASLTRDQELLWNSPGTIERQQDVHHGAALGAMAALAAAAVGTWTGGGGLLLPAVLLGLACLVGGMLLLVGESLSDGVATPAWAAAAAEALPWLARIAAAVCVVAVATDLPAVPTLTEPFQPAPFTAVDWREVMGRIELDAWPAFLPHVRGVGLGLVVMFASLSVATGVVAFMVRSRVEPQPVRRAFSAPGLLLLGGAVGAGMGAAVASTVARLVGRIPWEPTDIAYVFAGPLPEAVAATFLLLIVALGLVLVVTFGGRLLALERGESRKVRVLTALQQTLQGGAWLLVVLAIIGTIGTAAAVLQTLSEEPALVLRAASWLPAATIIAIGVLLACVAALAMEVWVGRAAAGAVLLLAAAGAGLVAARTEAMSSPTDLAVMLRALAFRVSLALPGGLVLAKGLSALRKRSDRRTVAILWDVGTFFPRWFHPLSPPTYGDRVVT